MHLQQQNVILILDFCDHPLLVLDFLFKWMQVLRICVHMLECDAFASGFVFLKLLYFNIRSHLPTENVSIHRLQKNTIVVSRFIYFEGVLLNALTCINTATGSWLIITAFEGWERCLCKSMLKRFNKMCTWLCEKKMRTHLTNLKKILKGWLICEKCSWLF